MQDPIPKIGVGVIIVQHNRILLGKRIGSHGEGTWALPGGHLDFGESPDECAHREVLEETGMSLDHFEKGPYTNDVFKDENKHYITLFIISRTQENLNPQIMEHDKCLEWRWFAWDNLPTPLFLPLHNLKESGYNPFITTA